MAVRRTLNMVNHEANELFLNNLEISAENLIGNSRRPADSDFDSERPGMGEVLRGIPWSAGAAALRCARDVEHMRNHAEADAIVGAAFAGLYEAEVRQALLRVDFAFSAVNDKTALAAQSAEESKKLSSISLDFAHRSALSGRGKTAHASTSIT